MNDCSNKLFLNSQIGYAYQRLLFNFENLFVDYEFIEINSSFKSILGLSTDILVEKKASELALLSTGAPVDWLHLYQKVISTGKAVDFQYHLQGSDKWFLLNASSPLEGYIVTFATDITDLILAEIELSKKVVLYKSAFEVAPAGISLTDNKTGIIHDVNSRFSEITGRTKKELQDIDWRDITHPEDIPEDFEKTTLLKQGEINTFTLKKRYIHKNGSEVWVKMRIVRIVDDLLDSEPYIVIVEDLTDLMETESNLLTSNETLLIAQQVARIGIWRKNLKTKKIKWSDELFDIHGIEKRPNGDCTSFDITGNIHPDDLFGVQLFYADALRKSNSIEYRITLSDGSIRHLFAQKSKVDSDKTGNPTLMSGIVQDITERKIAEMKIIKAKENEVEANEVKSQFLANMAHEIRTPLNGIMGTLELMKMTNLTEDQATFINISKKSSEALLVVLNDILDYSRIDAGKVVAKKEVFSLSKVINSVMDLFSLTSLKKEIAIEIHAAKEIPDLFIGDPFLLRQVLSNLIGNAVKFTPSGKIDITISNLESQTGSSTNLYFSIQDTGIGIAPEKTNLLFQRFSQVDSSNTRKYGGTGLGLAIAKNLIKYAGGEIGVESTEGKGSRFFFNYILENT